MTDLALRGVVAHFSDAKIAYRAFELYPEPAIVERANPGDLERNALSALAAEEGVDFVFEGPASRTRKAHEAAIFARDRQQEARMRPEIFAAYWSRGEDIGRVDVLLDVGRRVGLEVEELRIALDIDRYRDLVIADQDLARRLRVPGTPTIYVGDGPHARVIAGAHPQAELRRLVEGAAEEWRRESRDV